MKSSFTNKQRLITAAAVVLLIAAWKILSMIYRSDFILPSPGKTTVAAVKLFADEGFLKVVGTTVLRALTGFAIAGILGLGLGLLAGADPNVFALLNPFVVVIRSTPVIAFTLLALIWFSPDSMPVFIGMLTMFPLIFTNVCDGIRNIDRSLIQMARFYKVSRRRIVREIYIPAITPFIISGVSNAVGIGWRAVIVGEVLGQPLYGIGSRMQDAQMVLRVDVLIAWTFVVIFLSYCFDLIIRAVERKLVKWKS